MRAHHSPGWPRRHLRLLPCRAVGWALAALLVTGALAPTARADDDCPVALGGIGLGFLVPYRDCSTTLHFDVSAALHAPEAKGRWLLRLEGEIGALVNTAEHGGFIHLGPVLAVGGGGDTLDWPSRSSEYYVSPRLRGRFWLPPDLGFETLAFEAAVGPTFWFTDNAAGESVDRAGLHARLGLSAHGAAGLYVGYELVAGNDEDPDLGQEHRLVLGLAFTLGAALTGGTIGIWIAAFADEEEEPS